MSKLLIIRFSALGDVAMLVPMIENLANIYPKLSITILSRQQVAPLFADMPDNVHFLGGELLINLGIDLNSKEAYQKFHRLHRSSRWLLPLSPWRIHR